jgi:hypothetical protein
LAALLLISLWAAQAHAQWKWRDKDGRVTVSDRPPPRDVADKDILGRPAAEMRRVSVEASAAAASAAASAATSAGTGAAPVAKAPLDRELEARRKATETEAAAKAKADEEKQAARRADNCKRARSQMATLDSGQRMARVNDKGEREVLDDSARAEETRRAREIIASECR